MQRYLWQQADGRRHAYDTERHYPAAAGKPFTALCGQTVTPRTQDLVSGMWFDPTCPGCEDQFAIHAGWTKDELERLRAIRVQSTKVQSTR